MFIWNLDGLVRFCKVGLVLKHYILAQFIVCIMQFNSFVSGMLQLLCVDCVRTWSPTSCDRSGVRRPSFLRAQGQFTCIWLLAIWRRFRPYWDI